MASGAPLSPFPATVQWTGMLTPALTRSLAKAGKNTGISEPPVDWDAVQENFTKDGCLNDATLQQISDFTRVATHARRDLEKELKSQDPSREQIHQLAKLDKFLGPAKQVQQAFLEGTSRAALQAMVGASFTPLASVAAYLTWNPAPEARVRNLVDSLQKLEDGTSPMITRGNEVKPVHSETIWPTMLGMLDGAAQSARAGKPVPVDVQYFEMTSSGFLSKLAEAARAGCPVRINIDPSRPTQTDEADLGVDDAPRKLRALLQLTQIPNVDLAVSIFPVAEQLKSPRELMHRKLLRVGDQVLLSGMNANEGSGENLDTGYLMRGPAAHALGEEFNSDVKLSRGKGPDEIYGSRLMEQFATGTVAMTTHGLATTLDAIGGPTPAGVRIPSKPSATDLEELAGHAGVELGDLVDADQLKHALQYRSNQPLLLKPGGIELLQRLYQRIFEATGNQSNLARLDRHQPVSEAAAGNATVAVGTASEQREALVLQAISSAEEFAYVPTFVITRAVARALIARRDELRNQGRELDVRVVADAGVYGFGSTPNDEGFLALEDANIPVRWSLLARGDTDHDRKIHAKQILTDKCELVGSTNLSNKGIRDNWELSSLVYFDPNGDAARDANKKRFESLWERESIPFNSYSAAARLEAPGLGSDESRKRAMRQFLGAISHYEVQSGRWVESQLMANPMLAQRADELRMQGVAYGYARMQACREVLGDDGFYAALAQLPQRAKLDELNSAA